MSASPVRDEYEQAAAEADLVYVTDREAGYRRKPWGRGFTYLDPDGEHVKDEALRERFEALAIPPAWTDVWICADRRGHIQATGRDDQGRKQYIYHPRWKEVRSRKKYERLADFAEHLPEIRRRCDADMRKQSMSRERVLAVLVSLLEKTYARIGNVRYRDERGHYGLTTLEPDHVEARAVVIELDFVAKAGKEQHLEVRNRRLARQVRRLQELPGQELFTYCDEEGCGYTVGSGDVNDYLRETTGADYTAKDFRTWGGTYTLAACLLEAGRPGEDNDRDAILKQAEQQVCEKLGNTLTVCRQYYIHPAIPDAWEAGCFWDVYDEVEADAEPHGLSRDERFVVELIRRRGC